MAEFIQAWIWIVIPMGGLGVGAFAIWLSHQRRQKAFDLLRIYAEQGREPPPAVLAALKEDSDSGRYDFPHPKAVFNDNSAAVLWSRVVLLAFLSIGFYAMGAWIGRGVITFGFYITAFVLAAVAASALVRALIVTISSGGR